MPAIAIILSQLTHLQGFGINLLKTWQQTFWQVRTVYQRRL